MAAAKWNHNAVLFSLHFCGLFNLHNNARCVCLSGLNACIRDVAVCVCIQCQVWISHNMLLDIEI